MDTVGRCTLVIRPRRSLLSARPMAMQGTPVMPACAHASGQLPGQIADGKIKLRVYYGPVLV